MPKKILNYVGATCNVLMLLLLILPLKVGADCSYIDRYGSIGLPLNPTSITMIDDTLAVVAQNADSLAVTILNLADPSSPQIISTIDTASLYNIVTSVAVDGHFLYVGTSEISLYYDPVQGLYIGTDGVISRFDITDPTNPVHILGIDIPGGVNKITARNSIVYATVHTVNFETGITKVDFTANPPVEVSRDIWGATYQLGDILLDTSGQYCFVPAADSGVFIYDNTLPFSNGPVTVIPITLGALKAEAVSISIQDDRMALSAQVPTPWDQFSQYYDISNPTSPVLLHTNSSTQHSVKLFDRFVFWFGFNSMGRQTIFSLDTSKYFTPGVSAKESIPLGVYRDIQYIGNYIFATVDMPYYAVDSLMVFRYTGVPRPPYIVAPDTVHVNEGQNVTFDVIGYDADECLVTLDSISVRPPNMTILGDFTRSDSLQVSFNPDWNQSGVYHVSFRASDNDDSSFFTTTIIAHDRTPMFAQPTDYDLGDLYVGPRGLASADFDGDGDIDLVETGAKWISGTTYQFSLRILDNDSTGLYTVISEDTLLYDPFGPVVADLNGDSKPDIIYSYYDFNNVPDYDSIIVLMNNGNGTFAPPALYQSGRGIKYIHPFDADNDGDIDIAVYAFRDTTVVMLFNNGNGTFAPPSPFTVIGQPKAIATGDLDGDGDLDMVFPVRRLYPYSPEFQILLNDGAGAFTLDTTYTSTTTAFNSAIGDVDNDGDMDIVVLYDGGGSSGNQNGRVSVMLNNGSGSFPVINDYASTRYMKHIELADIDNDGALDIIVGSTYFSGSNHTEGAFQVLQNNGDGTFQAPIKYPVAVDVRGLQVADIDNDGDNDGIVITIGINGIQTLMNNTLVSNHPPTFQAITAGQTSVIEGDTLNIVIQTIDVDGQFASLSASGLPTGASFTDNGDGTATLHFVPGFNQAGRYPVSIFASDGLVVAQNDIEIVVYNGDGLFYDPNSFSLSGTPVAMSLADLNADGNTDVAVAMTNPASVETWANDGSTGLQLLGTLNVPYSPDAITTADIDGDTDIDILVSSDSANMTHLLFNNGTGSYVVSDSFPTGGFLMVSGDVDLDADIDIVITRRNATTGTYLLKNDGNGAFASAIWYDAGTHPADMAGADFDANGSLDIAVADAVTGHVWVLLSNGTGFAPAVPYSAGQQLSSLSTGDLDGDGDIDIITSSLISDTVSILINNGNGVFTSGWQGDFGYHPVELYRSILFPGDSISIIGIGQAFGGSYYVTGVAHNIGGGTYQLSDTTDLYWCGGIPVALALTRFDADNDEDLIILQSQPNNLTVLSGTSDA